MRAVALVIAAALCCAGCNPSVLGTISPSDQRDPGVADRPPLEAGTAAFNYYYPKATMTFTATVNADATKGAVTIAADSAVKAVPDLTQHHFLVYRHNTLASDTAHVSYDASGLLTQVDSTTQDQTAAAVEGVNGVIQQYASLASAIAKNNFIVEGGPSPPAPTPTPPTCGTAQISETATLDFSEAGCSQVTNRRS